MLVVHRPSVLLLFVWFSDQVECASSSSQVRPSFDHYYLPTTVHVLGIDKATSMDEALIFQTSCACVVDEAATWLVHSDVIRLWALPRRRIGLGGGAAVAFFQPHLKSTCICMYLAS
jgi:hypothetical protein